MEYTNEIRLDILTALRRIKMALASRYLFNNWLSLLIKYAFNKLGLSIKLRAKINNCMFDLDPENFASIVSRFSKRSLIKSIKCSGNKLLINDIEVNSLCDILYNVELFSKVLGWDYDNILGYWIKNGAKFKRIYLPILLIFNYGEYEVLDAKGKTIVDIGAFVGDSACYFALKGARKVIAIEPHPEAYEEMVENVKLNGLEDVIIPVNAGLGSRPSRTCIKDYINIESSSRMYYGPCGDGSVPIITLSDIINKFKIDSDAVLKMDCEGCEYDIILNDYEHVKYFRELIFEYHAYAVGKSVLALLRILSKDYECKITEGDKNSGIIYCTRKAGKEK